MIAHSVIQTVTIMRINEGGFVYYTIANYMDCVQSSPHNSQLGQLPDVTTPMHAHVNCLPCKKFHHFFIATQTISVVMEIVFTTP